jgi:GNAT superfamily N-acetyltransferase
MTSSALGSNVKIREEKLASFIEEMKPLLVRHWKEVAMHQDKIAFDPDYEKYLVMEEMGMVHAVTVRDEGRLIGYLVSLVAPNLHYKESVWAMNDVIYLDEAYRHTGVAQELIHYTQVCLKAMNVDVMSIHMKVHRPFDALMEATGFSLVERIYAKYLK